MAEQSQSANASPGEQGRTSPGMPGALRSVLFGVLGTLLAGAAYLMAVRGEALILDLAAFSRLFCF